MRSWTLFAAARSPFFTMSYIWTASRPMIWDSSELTHPFAPITIAATPRSAECPVNTCISLPNWFTWLSTRMKLSELSFDRHDVLDLDQLFEQTQR